MQASSPTQVRGNARIVVSRLAATLKKPIVGADSISARGCSRRTADRADIESAPTRVRNNIKITVSRLVAGPAPQFASLVKGRWPRRQARSEGLPRPEMPPPEAAATRKVPPCAAFRERLPASKQSPSLRLSPQPAPFDKGAKPTRGCSRRRKLCGRGVPLPYMPSGNDRPPGVFAPPWGAGRCKPRPLHRFAVTRGSWFPGWLQHLPPFCRGGPWPSRECSRRRGVRRDGASRPTFVLYVARTPAKPLRAGRLPGSPPPYAFSPAARPRRPL